MPEGDSLGDRERWLLAIVGSEPHVDGDTRLQKYGFLVGRYVLKGEAFYDDWEPEKFGPLSWSMLSDCERLCRDGYIRKEPAGSPLPVPHYSVTAAGRRILNSFQSGKERLAEGIRGITSYYSRKSLDTLLADTYALHPEFTGKSVIKGRVMADIMRRSVNVGKEIRLPYTDRHIGLGSISGKFVNEYPFNDKEDREMLAKKIGLAGAPPIDPDGFDDIHDLLSKYEGLTSLTDADIRYILEIEE